VEPPAALTRARRARSRGLMVLLGLLPVLLVGLMVGISHSRIEQVPTEAEVLDGASFADRRETSAHRAEAAAQTIAADSGLLIVGEHSNRWWCVEGQNNMKRHDGFGLKCDAVDELYLAWRGGLDAGAPRIARAVPSDCVLSKYADTPSALQPGTVTYGPSYLCVDGRSVAIDYVDTGALTTADWFTESQCDGSSVRCGEDLPGDEIVARARPFDCVARIYITQNIYTQVIG